MENDDFNGCCFFAFLAFIGIFTYGGFVVFIGLDAYRIYENIENENLKKMISLALLIIGIILIREIYKFFNEKNPTK
jgi:cytochrome bd-type quinol oxidase subunit 1